MCRSATASSRIGMVCIMFLLAGCVQTDDDALVYASRSLPATTPWDLEALSIPPDFEWDQGTQVRSLYYEGEPLQGKPTRVFAYYATPGSLKDDSSLDKDLPAIVLVHGGGGTAFPEWVTLWAERGYAAIAMDLAGRGAERVRLEDGGPDQELSDKFGGIDLPLTDQWPYHAIANVIRAHSLVRSFAEVDPDRTAITGISWGGYLTCIASGLDNRFQAAVPVYGCGFLHENSAWLGKFDEMSQGNRDKWVRYWDPSPYVGSTSVPVFFVNGGTDFAYPPDSHTKTFDLVKSEKNIRFVPHMDHGHIFDRPPEVEAFVDHYLNDADPLPKITQLKVVEDHITANVAGPFELIKAELHYTFEDPSGDPKTREWHAATARLDNNTILSKSPPEDTRMWFITVTDQRGFVVSSRVYFQ